MNKIPGSAVAIAAAVLVAAAGCASQPQAPIAPLAASQPADSASAEPSPDSGYPEADETAFLDLIERNWQSDDDAMPSDEELLAYGYQMCDDDNGEISTIEPVEGLSDQNSITLHTGAGYHLCPVD